MKKHKELTRVLALALAALLLLGVFAVPLTAFAAEAAPPAQTVRGDGGEGELSLNGLVVSGNIAVLSFRTSGGASLKGAEVSLSGGAGRRSIDENNQAVFDKLQVGLTYTISVGGYNTVAPNFFTLTEAGVLRLTVTVSNIGGGDGGGTVKPTPTATPAPTPSPSQPPVLTPAPSGGVETPTPAPTPSSGTETRPPVPSAGTEPPAPSADIKPTPSARPTAGTEPSAEPDVSGAPDATRPPAPDVPEPPKEPVRVEAPKDKVQLMPEEIEGSAEQDRDVQVDFVDGDGNVVDTVVIGAFDSHDAELVKDSEVWIERREDDRPVIQLVKDSQELLTDASIPHNVIQAARERQADVRVTFQQPDGSRYDFDALFPAGFFDAKIYDDQDTTMEYNPGEEQGWLIVSNQAGVHAGGALVIAKEAYEKAAEDGWGIKTRIYNPEDSGDLWYEWVFVPEELKAVARSFADTDLFISPDRPEDMELLDTLDENANRLQYMSVNHEGQLPAPAQLRVKNMAGFGAGDEVALLYCNEQAGELQTLLTGLTVGGDGYITYGMEHCSVYVLSAPRPVTPLWWYIAAAVGGLIALLLLLIFRKKKLDELTWLALGLLLTHRDGDGNSARVFQVALLPEITAAASGCGLDATEEDILKRLKLLKRKKYAKRVSGNRTMDSWWATVKGGAAYEEYRKTVVKHEQKQ